MKLKLIQVGLGGHGRGVGHHFVVPSTDFEYSGLVDINPGCLAEAADLFKVPKEFLFTDYEEAFRELQADAVLIEAVSPVHYEICKAALNNNLHVLIEKPFVINMEEAAELVELASRKSLKIMVNQNYRFFSTVQTLKRAIKDGKLGKPIFVSAQFYYNHSGKPYQFEMEDYMLLEMSVHHIDMIRSLLDSNISSVRGKTWNSPNKEYKGDPNVHAVYETESGIPVFYIGSLISKGEQTPWEGVWRIQCEDGSIHLDDFGEGYGVYITGTDQIKTKIVPFVPKLEGIHGVLKEFAESIRGNKEPLTSGRDNLNTLAALFATSFSSKEGKAVSPLTFIVNG